ncbi:hypothetical protein Tco_1386071 [Tanacetum coccineum]
MEDEFYDLVVKGNDLKTYVRRFQELAVFCQNMVPNTEKLMEVFIGGLPRSIEGNVTASKSQTLEEAITITQRLMEQVAMTKPLLSLDILFPSIFSCTVKGASCTQRKVSMVPFVFSIPFVLSWGGSISSDSFLPSILLLVVIIIMVVIVVVILIVVVVVIVWSV